MHFFKNTLIMVFGIVVICCFSHTALAERLPEKTNVDPNHNWTIHFNQELDTNSVDFTKVYVTKPYIIKNADGTEDIAYPKVLISHEVSKDKKSIIVKAPNGGYEMGQTYTLHISDDIRSKSDKKLKQATEMPFTIIAHPALQTSETLYDAIYNIIYHGVTDEVNLTKYTNDYKEILEVHEKVLNNHPELNYIGGASYNDDSVQYDLKTSVENIYERHDKIQQAKNEILDTVITDDMNELEKVKAVHDYIVLNTAYDYDNYLNGVVPWLSYQVDGVLLHGTAVCQGYALTMQYLLTQLGIEAKYVSGTSIDGEGHAWNKVKIDGQWYNIDATWNDPVPNVKDRVLYDYFLITDDEMAVDHIWDNSNLPKATSTKYQIFSENERIFESEDAYYFVDMIDEKTYMFHKERNEQVLIGSFIAKNMVFHGEWIYLTVHSYQNSPYSGGRLHKMKFDGSELTTLSSAPAHNLKIEGHNLAYTLGGDSSIHLIPLD